jgi:hypothetical protein
LTGPAEGARLRDELYAIWGIQETLLQTYRGVFITMQSIFIAAWASLSHGDNARYLLLAAGLASLVAWVWITFLREHDVDSVQTLIRCEEKGSIDRSKSGFALFKYTQEHRSVPTPDGSDISIRVPRLFKFWGIGRTRQVLGRIVPAIFFVTWVGLWLLR